MFVLQLPVEVSDNTHVVKVRCSLQSSTVVCLCLCGHLWYSHICAEKGC